METLPVIPYIISTSAGPVTSLSQCGHDVTVKKSCLPAPPTPHAFFFSYLWFPEIPWCFYGRKQRQIGFVCYSWGVVELSPCHNQTTCSKGCCPSGELSFSFNLLLVLSHFVSVTSVVPAPCMCTHAGTHNTSLTAGPSLQALGCLLLTLHICLSSSLPLSLPLSLLLI